MFWGTWHWPLQSADVLTLCLLLPHINCLQMTPHFCNSRTFMAVSGSSCLGWFELLHIYHFSFPTCPGRVVHANPRRRNTWDSLGWCNWQYLINADCCLCFLGLQSGMQYIFGKCWNSWAMQPKLKPAIMWHMCAWVMLSYLCLSVPLYVSLFYSLPPPHTHTLHMCS